MELHIITSCSMEGGNAKEPSKLRDTRNLHSRKATAMWQSLQAYEACHALPTSRCDLPLNNCTISKHHAIQLLLGSTQLLQGAICLHQPQFANIPKLH